MLINYITNTVLVQVCGTQDVAKICQVNVLKYGSPMKIGCPGVPFILIKYGIRYERFFCEMVRPVF